MYRGGDNVREDNVLVKIGGNLSRGTMSGGTMSRGDNVRSPSSATGRVENLYITWGEQSLRGSDLLGEGTDRLKSKLWGQSPSVPHDLRHWQLVYRELIRDVEHLKEVILCCWAEITQALVDSAIDQWSSRVDA